MCTVIYILQHHKFDISMSVTDCTCAAVSQVLMHCFAGPTSLLFCDALHVNVWFTQTIPLDVLLASTMYMYSHTTYRTVLDRLGNILYWHNIIGIMYIMIALCQVILIDLARSLELTNRVWFCLFSSHNSGFYWPYVDNGANSNTIPCQHNVATYVFGVDRVVS